MDPFRDNAAPPHPAPILVVGLNGNLVGLDRSTGRTIWKNKLKGGGHGEVALAITRGLVFASAQAMGLFCVDYLTGATLWSVNTTGMGRASIVVEEDGIFVAKGGYLDCFLMSGSKLWSEPLSGLGLGRISLGFPGNIQQADDPGTE